MVRALFFIIIALLPWRAQGETAAVPLWKTLPVAPPLPQADKSGLADVNGIKLYYAIFNKEGPAPVFLLHGGFTSSDEWGFEVPLLAKTHQVIIVDSRGHGRSSLGNQPLGFNLMASDVLELMNLLQITKASIVGWSDGGIIGLILAMDHPDRIDKVFTFGANYNLSGYKPEPSDMSLAPIFMSRAAAKYQKLSPTPGDFALLKKTLGKLYGEEPNLAPEALKRIKAPTVIACGEYDQFIKFSHFQELAALIPNAKLVVIPNVSHGGPLQDPVRFHQAVIELLDR